jgi:hypothetical protein
MNQLRERDEWIVGFLDKWIDGYLSNLITVMEYTKRRNLNRGCTKKSLETKRQTNDWRDTLPFSNPKIHQSIHPPSPA